MCYVGVDVLKRSCEVEEDVSKMEEEGATRLLSDCSPATRHEVNASIAA